MEKRKPTYDLEAFKAVAPNRKKVQYKQTALLGAYKLGFTISEIVNVIKTMRHEHFYKSMTAYRSNRLWQDVYHVPSEKGLLYIKFAAGQIFEFDLLSFKEK